jgi:hypothetical protein
MKKVITSKNAHSEVEKREKQWFKSYFKAFRKTNYIDLAYTPMEVVRLKRCEYCRKLRGTFNCKYTESKTKFTKPCTEIQQLICPRIRKDNEKYLL